MGKIFFITLFVVFAIGCSHSNKHIVLIETELGTIEVELYENKAPITVNNFLTYINNGLFNDGEFYRVVNYSNQPDNNIKIHVIQGGIGWDDSLPRLEPIIHETTNNTCILHKRGVISMARNEPGTASSEFFICTADEPELDYGGMRNPDGEGFAAFGKVLSGMGIVDSICNMNSINQMLQPHIKIISIKDD